MIEKHVSVATLSEHISFSPLSLPWLQQIP